VAAADLELGNLVRLRPASLLPSGISPMDVVAATVAEPEEPEDPASREALRLCGTPEIAGALGRKAAEKLLGRLSVPAHPDLLGFRGSATPYWCLDGSYPSLALVGHLTELELVRRPTPPGIFCLFASGGVRHQLPVADPLARLFSAAPDLSAASLGKHFYFFPKFLLVMLSPPLSGRCYKTVAAFLP
jgi:hypothetical protein